MASIDLKKLHALFLIGSVNNNLAATEPPHSIHYFTELAKACNITTTIIQKLPSISCCHHVDFIFIDLSSFAWSDEVLSEAQRLTHDIQIVLFNAVEGQYDERLLLLSGIAGLFYNNQRLDIVLRGITQLQKKERWFKRKTMNNVLSDLMDKKSKLDSNIVQQKTNLPILTRRENTIIGLVSKGAKNQEIADQLHISPNTVKTHLYSIFRKTSSRNRIELMSWTHNYTASYG